MLYVYQIIKNKHYEKSRQENFSNFNNSFYWNVYNVQRKLYFIMTPEEIKTQIKDACIMFASGEITEGVMIIKWLHEQIKIN